MDDTLHRENDQKHTNGIIEQVQEHTGPDRAGMPAQKCQGQPDHKKHYERARIGVRNGKDERT